MRKTKIFKLYNTSLFKQQLMYWASKYEKMIVLNSNAMHTQNNSVINYDSYDFVLAVDAVKEILPTSNSFDCLRRNVDHNSDWWFGFLSYDLKNELEDLRSDNFDALMMPNMHFFIPRWIFRIENDTLEILFLNSDEAYVDSVFSEINNFILPENQVSEIPEIKARISKDEYLFKLNEIKKHIARGNIYELNLCQEFYCEDVIINPLDVFLDLQSVSPTPYSCFYKLDNKYLMCASPERFMKKQGDKLISQPIKGTAKRGSTKLEDGIIKEKLFEDPKERAENIMIVDLVRNDMAKISKGGSVSVEELCGIYSFTQVHQMISTIVSDIDDNIHFVDAIEKCFPMGSMTGAPKLRAMQLIEEYETTKRALYSGAVGYISPEGDFDFNVVIRSLQYNTANKYLSFMVGGAITIKSNAEQEYQECILKSMAICKVLGK